MCICIAHVAGRPATPKPLRMCTWPVSPHTGRGESGWCSDMTSTHGVWRHARGSIPPLRRLIFGPRVWRVTWRVRGPSHGHLTMDPMRARCTLPARCTHGVCSAARVTWCVLSWAYRGHAPPHGENKKVWQLSARTHHQTQICQCQKAAWSSGMILA